MLAMLIYPCKLLINKFVSNSFIELKDRLGLVSIRNSIEMPRCGFVHVERMDQDSWVKTCKEK